MTPHPADELLVLWLDEELGQPEAGNVRAHVEACPACRARQAQFARVSREIAGLHRMPRQAAVRGKGWWWIPAVAAAAVIVVAVWTRPAPVRPLAPNPPVTAAPAERTAPVVPAVVARAPSKKAASAPSAKTARGFIPLPFSDLALPLDDPPVVRVSLPAASLRLASFRVSREAEGTTVLADVVLGMDGLPRAIRFVE